MTFLIDKFKELLTCHNLLPYLQYTHILNRIWHALAGKLRVERPVTLAIYQGSECNVYACARSKLEQGIGKQN